MVIYIHITLSETKLYYNTLYYIVFTQLFFYIMYYMSRSCLLPQRRQGERIICNSLNNQHL